MKSERLTVPWFLERTKLVGECRIWTSHCDPAGYGRFWCKGKSTYAHRWIYEATHGPIQPGLVVRHSCDTPACVNIEHLSVGTHLDNKRDSVLKGRHRVPYRPPTPRRGAASPTAKLKESDLAIIRERRAAGERTSSIAASLSISATTVYRVLNGSTWRHVLGGES